MVKELLPIRVLSHKWPHERAKVETCVKVFSTIFFEVMVPGHKSQYTDTVSSHTSDWTKCAINNDDGRESIESTMSWSPWTMTLAKSVMIPIMNDTTHTDHS